VRAAEGVLLASIVVPLAITGVLTWVFLRGKRDDPDEQRWRRLAEQRREAERDKTDE
jgi:hypothetical protein